MNINSMNKKIFLGAAVLLGVALSACDDSKSYAELLAAEAQGPMPLIIDLTMRETFTCRL